MNKEQLATIKDELEDEKAMLEVKIDTLEKGEDFGSDVDSLEEETDESEAWENQSSAAQELRGRLAEVEFAIERIEKGTYGVCGECGEAIGEDMLRVNSTSKLCRTCKKLERENDIA
ncbi:MAG: hypothetical protein ACD_81C00065G0002 [uncultured bacterium]|uniref:Zinc finger DksA/TraR C4-type domain-containing protein n=2 Tax=Candidatus Wolfeibacteriota TaxID=1752735 RepID=A0A0G1H7Y6_9BACT|nr:MAG: hypothetical protein ACD_81C00065G0002 [uncultured bacterium]KKR12098.1 MAG: hypothetical protein UT41_C0003G0025 [Candidatus Wolfebacteria bacterium GW2011_GWC2_39_22]KKT42920.1 MAG: hypothetical protein UW32_C0003G0023 [Candidatus Wolfebacteria bacterium GW2011_GWE2_44_13]HBI25298.1 hypothetical protein [Candidatus Wolfebacteria bacterium]